MIDDDPPFSTIESRIFEKSEKSARVYNKSVQLRINERRIREEVEVMERGIFRKSPVEFDPRTSHNNLSTREEK